MNFKNINLKLNSENINKQKEKFYLLNIKYETSKNRILVCFAKDPLSNNYDYIHSEKYHPYFIINKKPLNTKILIEKFKGTVSIIKIGSNYQVTAKNYNILKDFRNNIKNKIVCSKLISIERQFLIKKNWSYFDQFTKIHKNKIQKINNSNSLNLIIKKYLEHIDENKKINFQKKISKFIIYSNLTCIKFNNNLTLEVPKLIRENICHKNNLFNLQYKYNKNNIQKEIINKINLKIRNLKQSIKISKSMNIKKNKLQLNLNFSQYNNELDIFNKLKSELQNNPIFIKTNPLLNEKITKISNYFPILNITNNN